MNKALIVLLAVCLISVHAFVKRDVTEAESSDNTLESIKKQFEDFSKDAGEKLKEAFDPDTIKTKLNEFTDSLNKALDNLKSQNAAKQ